MTKTTLEQVFAVLEGMMGHINLAAAIVDHAAKRVIHHHDFIKAETAHIADLVTLRAPYSFEKAEIFMRFQTQIHNLAIHRLIGFFAVRAQATHQALGDNGCDRGCQKKRLNAHIAKARNGCDGRICVDGG